MTAATPAESPATSQPSPWHALAIGDVDDRPQTNLSSGLCSRDVEEHDTLPGLNVLRSIQETRGTKFWTRMSPIAVGILKKAAAEPQGSCGFVRHKTCGIIDGVFARDSNQKRETEMPLRQLDFANSLVYQSTGDREAPPVIYLPGVHGDWTPQVSARPRLSRDFRFIETAYPRVHMWSIDDYAGALNELLDRLGIESAHIVGESFGSLVGWRFGLSCPERVRSFTLLGGFTRPPRFGVAAAAAAVLKTVPTGLLESTIDLYVVGKSVTGQHRESFDVGAYPAARTSAGRLATANRMSIIQASDFSDQLTEVQFPVRYLGGSRDIVVPVRREIATLHARLPTRCDFQGGLVAGAPHMVIVSHPEEAVERIANWIREIQQQRPSRESAARIGPGDLSVR